MSQWRVGDPVVITSNANGRGGGTSTVVGVGPKWLTVHAEFGRKRRFSVLDGREDSDGRGGFCYAQTPKQAAEQKLRAVAMARLSALTRGHSWDTALTPIEADSISGIIERANMRIK